MLILQKIIFIGYQKKGTFNHEVNGEGWESERGMKAMALKEMIKFASRQVDYNHPLII